MTWARLWACVTPNHALQQLVNRYRQPEQVDQRPAVKFDRFALPVIRGFTTPTNARLFEEVESHLDRVMGGWRTTSNLVWEH